jgi:hypothetical protein
MVCLMLGKKNLNMESFPLRKYLRYKLLLCKGIEGCPLFCAKRSPFIPSPLAIIPGPITRNG